MPDIAIGHATQASVQLRAVAATLAPYSDTTPYADRQAITPDAIRLASSQAFAGLRMLSKAGFGAVPDLSADFSVLSNPMRNVVEGLRMLADYHGRIATFGPESVQASDIGGPLYGSIAPLNLFVRSANMVDRAVAEQRATNFLHSFTAQATALEQVPNAE